MGVSLVSAKRRMGNSEWRIEGRKWRASRPIRYSPFRYSPSGAADLAENGGELLLELLHQLGTRARDHGKILEPLERPAGVDDGARIGRARLVEQWIQRPAPGP